MTTLKYLAVTVVIGVAVALSTFVGVAFLSSRTLHPAAALILGAVVGFGIGWCAGAVAVAILRWEPDES